MNDNDLYEKYLSLAKTLTSRGYSKAYSLFIVIACNNEDMIDPLISYLNDNPEADKDDIEVWLYGEDGQGNHLTVEDDEDDE